MSIIYYDEKNKQWNFNTHKVIYTQYDEKGLESYTNDLNWWYEFCEKWNHTTIESIEELKFTNEQKLRLEYVKNLKEDYGNVYSYYVENGDIHEDYKDIPLEHPFHIVVLKNKEVKDLESRILTASEVYERLNKEDISLEDLKNYKLNQLNEMCNKSITTGFKYEIDGKEYLFSSSTEAQLNFQATDALFKEGLIQEVEWTVTNLENNIVERINISQEVFNSIKMILFNHVNSQIRKYRNDLQPQVLSAKSNEEVDSINW